MKKTLILTALISALSLPLSVPEVSAQTQSGGVDSSRANTRANRRAAQEAKQKAEEKLFPNATRAEPDSKLKLGNDINALIKLQNEEDYEAVLARADALMANPKAGPADRAKAAYIAAVAAQGLETEHYDRASAYLQKALAENALSNNEHYSAMRTLAEFTSHDGKHVEALKFIDQFLAETKSNDLRMRTRRAEALYELKRYAEAAETIGPVLAEQAEPDPNTIELLSAIYNGLGKPAEAIKLMEGLAAKNPNDKRLQFNLASFYQEAEQNEKAVALFQRMRQAGLLTESRDYELGAALLQRLDGREKDSIAFINEGFDKGILQPSVASYSMLGGAYYNADQFAEAAAAWRKGAAMSDKGDLDYNVATTEIFLEHWDAARVAAKQALAKGVRRPGDAWLVIARVEEELGNQPARETALREAAKYPESRDRANRSLRK